jgi:histidine ammonia-lyase
MFQAQMIQPGLGFITSVSTRRCQALVNCSCRLPFRIFLQQPRGIKSGLVVPEELTLSVWASRNCGIVQDFVKCLERARAVVFFLV